MSSVLRAEANADHARRGLAAACLEIGDAVAGKSHIQVSGAALGGPIALSLELIDEDPYQPRTSDNPGFSPKSLTELAAAIRLRGVKTPISVRPHPEIAGRYLINHGARRFRASRLAGMTTIPGFIDANYNHADQVVENLHRNELTAREIADYIGRELAKGLRKGEIARQISKSAAFITQHAALLDLPDSIAHAFSSGRVRDVTLVSELLFIHRKAPEVVASWLADESQDVTRASVRMLRAFIDQKMAWHDQPDSEAGEAVVIFAGEADAGAGEQAPSKSAPWVNPVLSVRYRGRSGRLLVRRRPSAVGRAWLRYDDDCALVEVDLADVELVALLEG
jgi:ParB family chromosome partitioning protein